MLGLSNQFPKNIGESANLVHQKSDPYRTKGVALRYCQIAVFQGFRGAKTQPSFGPKLAAAEALAGPARKSRAAAAQTTEIVDLSRRAAPPIRVRTKQMLVTWPVFRNRTLKALEGRGPKFHAIQIAPQALQRFDQVSHDCICCRFRHRDALCLVSDVAASSG